MPHGAPSSLSHGRLSEHEEGLLDEAPNGFRQLLSAGLSSNNMPLAKLVHHSLAVTQVRLEVKVEVLRFFSLRRRLGPS